MVPPINRLLSHRLTEDHLVRKVRLLIATPLAVAHHVLLHFNLGLPLPSLGILLEFANGFLCLLHAFDMGLFSVS